MKKFIKNRRKNIISIITTTIFATLASFPMIASAGPANFKEVVQLIIGMIQAVVPLVVGLTLLVFIWGIFQLVRNNSEDSRKEAIAVITYGIIALFVMVSVWGLVSILTSTFFSGGLAIPQLKTS